MGIIRQNREAMNGNGHTTLQQIKALVESLLDGVVNMEGEIHIEDVVRALEEELDTAAIQDILRATGKEDLLDVIIMFI
jgi:hypothetical protein